LEEEGQRTGLIFGDDDSEDEDKLINNKLYSTYLHTLLIGMIASGGGGKAAIK
jgi:hypothetical protein